MRPTPPRLVLLAALFLNATAPAQEGLPGFSEARLLSLSRSADSAACMKFEATFSRPLREPPKATLDVARTDAVKGILSFVLDVTRIARDRFSYAVGGLDPAACRRLRSNPAVLSVEGGLGPDGRPVFPDQRSFPSR